MSQYNTSTKNNIGLGLSVKDTVNKKNKTKHIQYSHIAFPTTKNKSVWIGFYGGHYDIAVLFKKKPRNFDKININVLTSRSAEAKVKFVNIVDLHNESIDKNILGSVQLDFFKLYFPSLDLSNHLDKDGRPFNVEIEKKHLFQAILELPLNSDDEIELIAFDAE